MMTAISRKHHYHFSPLLAHSLIWIAIFLTLSAAHSSQQQQETTVLSPDGHLKKFEAACSATARSHKQKNNNAELCRREPTTWRWLYAYEFQPTSSKLLVKDSSIDERLANVQYTINSARISYSDAFKFDSGNRARDAQNVERVAGARVNDELCGVHLRAMLEQIEQLEQWLANAREQQQRQRQRNKDETTSELDEKFIYLARVLDSFGRYDSGYLSGRSQTVGDYNQCVEARLLLPAREASGVNKTQLGSELLTSTRFCWARMSADASLNGALRRRAPLIELQDRVLSSGICIPASCHTRNFMQYRALFEQLVKSQFKLPSSLYVREHLDLESIFCLVDDDSPHLSSIPLSGKLFLLATLTWVALVLWASLRRTNSCNTRASSLAACVDIRQSWLEFTEEQQREECGAEEVAKSSAQQKRIVDLSSLNLIKVILCAYVVMGHSAMTHFFNAQDQLRAQLHNEIDPISTAVLVGTFSVDTFLVITGLLLAWMLLRKMNKLTQQRSTKNNNNSALPSQSYFKLFVGLVSMRYIRLVPLYFIVQWFKKSLFARLGSGPFWDHGLNKQTSLGACENSESWLTPLALNSCYLPLFKQCLTPTWSISIDFQLCVLVAPVVLLSYRFRGAAKLVLASAWFYCAYLGYYDITAIEPEILQDLVDCKHQGIGQFFNKYSILYTSPKLRFCCIAIGALAGLLLYEYEETAAARTKKENHNWPRVIARPLTIFAIAWEIFFFATLLNTQWIQAQIAPYHSIFMYNVVALRALWSLANSILFLRMTTDWKDSVLMRLNSMKLWKILSKLNLVILLIHWDMIVFYQNYQIDTYHLKKWNWFMLFGGVYLFSLVLGTLIHITLENPLDRIIRHYLYGEKFITSPAVTSSKEESDEEEKVKQSQKKLD